MAAYYNEIDPYAAQWLRNLISAGHIASGFVDERSIEDVYPSDIREFMQCHFFAGIGIWSLALRNAGWADDRPVWTGSCPCQPFSAAGSGAGFSDERHLWPAFFHLIQECRPAVIFGEQVASRDADPWIDLVQDDMEGLEYGVAAVPFPSAGVGAPHIRDRLYWVADCDKQQWDGCGASGKRRRSQLADGGSIGRVADSNQHGCIALPINRCRDAKHHAEPCGEPGRLGHADSERARRDGGAVCGALDGEDGQLSAHHADAPGAVVSAGSCPTNGLWSAADWLLCRDGKWRPVEPCTFPLVDGRAHHMGRGSADWHTTAGPQGFGHRAGRLKAYGNAINAKAAEVFIRSAMSCMP